MARECCTPIARAEPRPKVVACPNCGQRGRQVALITVQAQVAISLRKLMARLYRFCPTPECMVVYYPEGGLPITRDQLRERVFQKEPAADVLVCYCFRYSVGLLQQSSSAERSAILADIVDGTRQGQCACELRNPQGSCCLANVRRLIGETPSEEQVS